MRGEDDFGEEGGFGSFVATFQIVTPAPTSQGFTILPAVAGPGAGWIWDIRGYQVSGATALETLTGRIDIYIGPYSGAGKGDIGLYWVDSTKGCGLPLSETFSRYQRVVRSGETIWAVVSGGLANDEYIFKGQYWTEPE